MRSAPYAYDAMSRLRSRMYPDTTSVGFTYTPTGRRATASDARGVTSYAYDTRDRVVATVYPDGRELDYAYDARGARTKLTAKVGASVLTTTTRYDASGRAIEIVDPTGRKTTLAYDAAGQRTALTYPNGTTTSYTYDMRGRVARIHAGADATDVTSFAYTMDAAGRRTRIDELAGVTRMYGYDGIDRLTSEAVTGSLAYVKTFAYDPVGNRLTQTTTGAGADVVTYGYDTRDRLLTENATSYAYDANGNTTTKSGEATYAWDFDNRLVGVSTTASGKVANDYDVDGTRVRTTVTPPAPGATSVTNLLVDTAGGLSHVVAETDAAGALTALYVRDGGELLAVMRPAGGGTWTTRWVHADALGSVRALTDEDGVVIDARAYEAFGTMNVEAGSDPLPYRFAGEPFEGVSGLANHRARWMDSGLGRFHGMDPADALVRVPSTLHRYAYARAEPIDRIDPSGQFDMVSVGGILGSLNLGIGDLVSLRPFMNAASGQNGIFPAGCMPSHASGTCNQVVLGRQLQDALLYINLTATGKLLIGSLINVVLTQVDFKKGGKDTALGKLVTWDPFQGLGIRANLGDYLTGRAAAGQTYSSILTPALGLAHELGHTTGSTDPDDNIGLWEKPIARQLRELGFSEGLRDSYDAKVDRVEVWDSTSNSLVPEGLQCER